MNNFSTVLTKLGTREWCVFWNFPLPTYCSRALHNGEAGGWKNASC
jgi:hypothetical protein